MGLLALVRLTISPPTGAGALRPTTPYARLPAITLLGEQTKLLSVVVPGLSEIVLEKLSIPRVSVTVLRVADVTVRPVTVNA